VLRSLAEVAVRTGRCRQALDFAARAAVVAEEAGLSPGPSWYTMAMVELAAGSLTKAAAYAERGVRASEQEHDGVYLRRNLHAVGVARLRSGDPRRGVAALLRLRDLEERYGATDPTVLRWHGDLAAALTAVGEHQAAAGTVATARRRAEELGRSAGVLAGLDRAAALVLAERGDPGAAARLARSAARRLGDLDQPIEQGHTLLVLGQAERRRRCFAAARTAIAEALDIFVRVGAKPWLEQAATVLSRVEGVSDQDSVLTAAEARIAALVRQGASNREIATQIFVSVKTVEATLTRIYRKLGVRSRTQLSSRLGGG
jgi:DNA-binding CsgD family transcriptional regulator